MGVRFTRAVELQHSDDYRLCDVCVDEPQSEGTAPRRYTSYRVSSQVRRSGTGWITCRHRFSEFERLHAALIEFLPGVSLPPLPEKRLANSLDKAVVARRAAQLGRLLQEALDHPICATCDGDQPCLEPRLCEAVTLRVKCVRVSCGQHWLSFCNGRTLLGRSCSPAHEVRMRPQHLQFSGVRMRVSGRCAKRRCWLHAGALWMGARHLAQLARREYSRSSRAMQARMMRKTERPSGRQRRLHRPRARPLDPKVGCKVAPRMWARLTMVSRERQAISRTPWPPRCSRRSRTPPRSCRHARARGHHQLVPLDSRRN